MADFIEITRARENNLENIDLKVPRRKITVFTGVSGSGKSSIVFDTIAAEAQRQLNETFTAFARNRLPKYGQPDVDAIEGLSAPIIIDQRRIGGNSRSTVGTITDLYALLRLLFSRAGTPHAGPSNVFSFNDPRGMCPRCEGLGKAIEPDVDSFFDMDRSLNEGAILHPDFKVGNYAWGLYTLSGLFDNDKKLADYTDDEWKLLLYGRDVKIRYDWPRASINSTYEGVIERFSRLYIRRDTSEMGERSRAVAQRFTVQGVCPLCEGTRLNERALSSWIDGYNIAELAAMEATELVAVIRTFTEPAPLVESLTERLAALVDIGLGYLSLDRETASLSGGESQRIKMVRHLSSSLTEMLYIFDEPTIGLHARDVHRMGALLTKLRDKGNTVLVVEHDRDVIEMADHVVDVGPGAGVHGGRIVFAGPDIGGADTLTGRHLTRARPLKPAFRTPAGTMTVSGATAHNLKNVTVGIPAGVLTVVTGVAGSGKSSLIHEEFLKGHPDAVVVDQAAVGASRRSSPATYTGIMDDLRRLFARENGVRASLFSFNSDGACPNCQGVGVVYLDLAFMDGLKQTCEVCGGRRFKDEVLRYRLRGKSISDVLEMPAEEALAFFQEPRPHRVLQAVNDVGLDYLKLGQPLSTLSGGENQRIKLATELHKSGGIYVLDEPTTGLHMSDIGRLLDILDRLVDQGNSVIVIEHNLDVVKHADWIIDLGPEGGHRGGQVMFEGTPDELRRSERSITAEYLRGSLR